MQVPQVPNATDTANAQTTSNINTATAQSNLNHVNQVTPTGSLTYAQTGTNPDGTPITTATTSLSAPEQHLLGTNQGTAQTLSNAGQTLAGQVQQNASQPQGFSQQQDYLNSLTNGNLDYNWDRQQGSLDQQLANEGLNVNDEAYGNAQRDFSTDRSAAYNAANLNNFTTAQQSQMATQNQPINELSALLSQSQVQQPQFQQTGQSGVSPTDVSALTQQQYANQQQQYNGFWGGVGNIASSLGGFLFNGSDRKLKTDIGETPLKTPDGIPMKTFRYKGSPLMHLGVIAQDVEKKRPDAVATMPGGFKGVQYGKIGSPLLTLGAKKVA